MGTKAILSLGIAPDGRARIKPEMNVGGRS